MFQKRNALLLSMVIVNIVLQIVYNLLNVKKKLSKSIF